jgi:hypothetical protein
MTNSPVHSVLNFVLGFIGMIFSSLYGLLPKA